MAAYDDQAKAFDRSPGSNAPSAKRHQELMERSKDGSLFREF